MLRGLRRDRASPSRPNPQGTNEYMVLHAGTVQSPCSQLEVWSCACSYLVAAKVQPSLDSLTHDNWRWPPRRHPKVASSRPGCCENPILCGSVMGNRSANFKGGGPPLRASAYWRQKTRPDEWETWNPATRPASARWPPISSAPAAGFSLSDTKCGSNVLSIPCT